MSKQKQRALAWFRSPLTVLIAIATGLLIGTRSLEWGRALAPLGDLYLSLLLMCIIPILGTAVVSSLAQMVARHRLGRNLGLIVVVFWVGLFLAAATGTLVGWVTGLGEDLQRSAELGNLLLETESTSTTGSLEDLSASGDAVVRFADLFEGDGGTTPGIEANGAGAEQSNKPLGFLAYLTKLVPRNLLSAVIEENYLGVLFFSVLMGVALGLAPAEPRAVAIGVFEAFFDALLRIITWVIFLLPLGLVFIVAGEVSKGGLEFVPVLGKVIAVSVVTTLLAMVVFTVTIWRTVGMRPLDVLRGLKAPLIVAFATSSSLAAIPPALVALKKNFGLNEENVKLLLPLGFTMNPIGSALFFSISSIFAVQLHTRPPTISEFETLLMITVGAVLAGLAAMGLPGPSAVWMLGLVLEPIGVPPEVGIIALLAVSPIIDPLFTVVNVFGNCTATCILDKRLSSRGEADAPAAPESKPGGRVVPAS